MNKLSLIVLLILIFFNIKLRIPAKAEVAPELVSHVETFKRLCKTYKKDCSKVDELKVTLVSMKKYDVVYKMLGINGYVIGHCWRDSKEVEINIEYFNRASTSEIEQLVVHELGHCALDLEHTEGEPDIMNPYSLDDKFYLMFYNELMNRVFSCEINCPVVQYK